MKDYKDIKSLEFLSYLFENNELVRKYLLELVVNDGVIKADIDLLRDNSSCSVSINNKVIGTTDYKVYQLFLELVDGSKINTNLIIHIHKPSMNYGWLVGPFQNENLEWVDYSIYFTNEIKYSNERICTDEKSTDVHLVLVKGEYISKSLIHHRTLVQLEYFNEGVFNEYYYDFQQLLYLLKYEKVYEVRGVIIDNILKTYDEYLSSR